MKFKSALRQSIQSLPAHLLFLGVAALVMAFWTNWMTIMMVSLCALPLGIDLHNIIYIKIRSNHEPGLLESNTEKDR